MPLDASPCVVASSLSHRYGATTALDQASLTIPTAFLAAYAPTGEVLAVARAPRRGR
jgi:hypothetical protein